MISHFQWKPLFKKAQLPGWKISFFIMVHTMKAFITKRVILNGALSFRPHEVEPTLKEEIHELMLFHVYD